MGEWRYNHAFLIPALGGGEWSALRPGRFTPRKQLLVRNEDEVGWAPQRRCGHFGGEKKISQPGQEINSTVLETADNYTD